MDKFDEARIAHLQMIQSVISRMAGNSFALKTLAVTLTTGVVALIGTIEKFNPIYLTAPLLPIAVFWWLDARYLQLERLYRALYDAVRQGAIDDPFSMNIAPYKDKVASAMRVAWSWSVAGIYVALLAVLGIVWATLSVLGR